MRRRNAGLTVPLLASTVLVLLGGAQAAHARQFTVALTASISGTYSDHVEFDTDRCGNPDSDINPNPNSAVFDENATFAFRYEARPLTFTLTPRSRASAKGRRRSAGGQWHQRGNWYPGNRCTDPPRRDDCTGAIGFNGNDRRFAPASANAVVYYNGKGAWLGVHSGARSIGELTSSDLNCPSVTGDGAKPVFGLRGALEPWETVYTEISAAKLERVRPGRTLTVKAKSTLQPNGWDPSTCNDARPGACTGHFKVAGTIAIKMLR